MYSKETARKYLPMMAALIAIKKQKTQLENQDSNYKFPDISVDSDTNSISIGDREIMLPDQKVDMSEKDIRNLHIQIEEITTEKTKDIKKGAKGAVGDRGFRGDVGDVGDRGSRGADGDVGEQGIQGVTGEAGISGIDGTSGIDGKQGIQGVPGIIGKDGISGIAGKHGDIGEQGIQGVTGRDGISGLKGLTGDRGLIGEAGKIGDKGDDGSQGERGKDFDDKKVTDMFNKMNSEFSQFKIMISNQISHLAHDMGGGAHSGGGSVNVRDNDDVIFQQLHELDDGMILQFNKTLNKFEFIALAEAQDTEVVKYDKLIDEANTSITYIGEAVPGTANTASLWRIQRIDSINDPDLDLRWADGVATFIKIWDDRATFTY